MKENNHWKKHYQPVTEVLSGSYNAFDVYRLSKPYNCTGYKDYIDGVVYGNKELGDIPTSAIYTEKDFQKEANANKTFENWMKQQTPFMDVDRSRIAVTPKYVEAGYKFKRNEESLMMDGANPASDVAQSIIRTFRKKNALMFINALATSKVRASTVTKDADTGEFEDVESDKLFPDSQKYTCAENYIALEDLTACQAKTQAEDVQVVDEDWYMLLSPLQAKKMIDMSLDRIYSKDFVSDGRLDRGGLPKLLGFIPIIHPLMGREEFKNKAFMFTKTAIAKANFVPLDINVGESPTQRFQTVLYYCEDLDYKRRDDGRVIQVTVPTE